nr:MAG TPA: hypothetical protein [Caudoviricetes sp.]
MANYLWVLECFFRRPFGHEWKQWDGFSASVKKYGGRGSVAV